MISLVKFTLLLRKFISRKTIGLAHTCLEDSHLLIDRID